MSSVNIVAFKFFSMTNIFVYVLLIKEIYPKNLTSVDYLNFYLIYYKNDKNIHQKDISRFLKIKKNWKNTYNNKN